MSSSIEIVTTPTADTAGTTLVLRTAAKHYVFGNLAEGTQRAMAEQGTRLLKAQDFFLTGKAEWCNTGGLIGMMLTLADSGMSSFNTSMEAYEQQRSRGKAKLGTAPVPPHFNIYGPANLKHTICTCRRFIFRKGIPVNATEFTNQLPSRDDDGKIVPTWEDKNIQVWAMSTEPTRRAHNSQAESDLEAQRQHFDEHLNTFEDHRASPEESSVERIARHNRIRDATIKFMFNSNWSFDTLVERHISEVEMPAAIFVRDPNSHGYKPYHGPKPGGTEPLPDIKVFTRTPWPGAKILSLPPTAATSASLSYIVRSQPTRGTFDVARAKALGVKPGPDFGKLTAGQSVQSQNGDWVTADQVVGANRPGQGVAILDIPSVDYLEQLLQHEEFRSPHIMTGIEAFIWMLGPGICDHPALIQFQQEHSHVKHIISSTDTAPNRVTYDSVAGQTTRLGQIDPSRYRSPVYDNETTPQSTLAQLSPRQITAPDTSLIADRGMYFTLMPKFAMKTDTITSLFEAEKACKVTTAEVLRLAQTAEEAVQQNRPSMRTWRQLLARPDTEITTLGTGSALPSKYRNVSATLVRVPGIGNYLLDCGENTLGQLSRLFGVNELARILKDLRVIWISHLHADHHLGTASVIRAWYHLVHGGVPNSQDRNLSTAAIEASHYGLSVISHSGMLQWLQEYSKIEDFGYSRILPFSATPNEFGNSTTLSVQKSFDTVAQDSSSQIDRQSYESLFGFTDIQTAKVAHCHGSMAVSMTFPPSPDDAPEVKPLKISYSGDCRPSYHFAKIGKDSTVLIHEATFDDELQGDAKAKKHSTTSEALDIGSRMDAKAVVLTHFSQRYQKIPVLQSVTDGELESVPTEPMEIAEDANEEETEVDPTIQNADNMDMHPKIERECSSTTKSAPSLQHQPSSLQGNERVIKVKNKDMKVAVAFDYMRVKIGEIVELEKFNEALNELLIKEETEDNPAADDVTINANGKKTSEDEAGASKKKQKKQAKPQRNN